MPDFHTEIRFINAKRKPAQCEWCGQEIAIGDQAVSWSWFTGNKSYTSYEHRECHEATLLDPCMHGLEEEDPYPCWSHRRGQLCIEASNEDRAALIEAKIAARVERRERKRHGDKMKNKTKKKSLDKHIDEKAAEIDAHIKAAVPNARIDKEERRMWVLNDETLYRAAQKDGVDV